MCGFSSLVLQFEDNRLAGRPLEDCRLEVVVVHLDLDLACLARDVFRSVQLGLNAADRRAAAFLALVVTTCHNPLQVPSRRKSAAASTEIPRRYFIDGVLRYEDAGGFSKRPHRNLGPLRDLDADVAERPPGTALVTRPTTFSP